MGVLVVGILVAATAFYGGLQTGRDAHSTGPGRASIFPQMHAIAGKRIETTLTDTQLERVARLGAALGASRASVIRRALDAGLPLLEAHHRVGGE